MLFVVNNRGTVQFVGTVEGLCTFCYIRGTVLFVQ